LVIGAARLVQPEVLDKRERPVRHECFSSLVPAEIGIDPVHRRGREHGLEAFAGKGCILEAGVHELYVADVPDGLPRERDQPIAGLDGRDPQAACEEAAGQLPGPTADLKHSIANGETCGLTGVIQQRLRICRAVTIVLVRDLVEDLAVAALECSVRHRSNVGRVPDDRPLGGARWVTRLGPCRSILILSSPPIDRGMRR
jgi:hypothetical protein